MTNNNKLLTTAWIVCGLMLAPSITTMVFAATHNRTSQEQTGNSEQPHATHPATSGHL
jgi:hypothetical protein